MDKKKLLIIGSIALVVVIGGAALLYRGLGAGSSSPMPAATHAEHTGSGEAKAAGDAGDELEPAPDFTVLDTSGNPVSLSDLRGKPVIVSFWASWCGVCKQGMPDFDDAFAAYGGDVHFMMVNLTAGSETREVAEAYIAENGYAFPVYFDTEMSAASAYAVNAVPVTYLIDAEGNLVAYGQGRLGLEGIEQGIEMAS